MQLALEHGEACSLDYTTDIDFDKEEIIVHTTLSKQLNKDDFGEAIYSQIYDDNRKKFDIVVGKKNATKTGRKLRKRKQIEKRVLPFILGGKNGEMEKLLKEQIKISETNPNNEDDFLFCNRDGSPITAQQLTSYLKIICRDLKIKTDITTGCSIHMTKHTFITRCIESPVELQVISKLVGTGIQVLERTYAHVLTQYRDTELLNLVEEYEKNNFSILGNKTFNN